MSAHLGYASGLVDIPTSVACAADARVHSIGGGIAPLFAGAALCGPAKTAQCAPGQNGAIHHAVHTASAGDIIIASAGGDLAHGAFGELLTLGSLKRGIAGLVIYGSVRDVEAIHELGFPVFCLSANPGQTNKSDLGEVDIALAIGGAVIKPKDIIIADADGVVVVPHAIAAQVAEKARKVLLREDEIRRRLESGETTYEIFNMATAAGAASQMEHPDE